MAQSEISDLDETDSSNTTLSDYSLDGAVANMSTMDNVIQATLGMLKRWFKTSLFRLRDSTDPTKLLAFDLSGISTATTSTLTVPDASGTIILTSDIATQSDQEAATSTAKLVTSGRQHFHPSAAKCWVHCGVSGNIFASYGVSSVTDVGVGEITVNQSVTMSSNSGPILVSPFAGNTLYFLTIRSYTATTFQVRSWSTAFNLTDPSEYFAVRYGDI